MRPGTSDQKIRTFNYAENVVMEPERKKMSFLQWWRTRSVVVQILGGMFVGFVVMSCMMLLLLR